jgi:hypothetical protein
MALAGIEGHVEYSKAVPGIETCWIFHGISKN